VRRVVRLLPLALVLFLAGCSLAEDVTPPPGLLAGQPVRPVFVGEPTAIALPAEAPDPSAGAAIFSERCAPCHGAQGLGDGEQSTNLPVPPAALGNPDVARAASLSDWYQMVTVGDIDRFMPPFQSLTDAQRLDVAAYALTLSASPEEVALGREAYEANECASCHAMGGDGPAGALTALSLAERSGTELFGVITDGGAGGEMPAFGDSLNADERWALVAFIRSLWTGTGEPAVALSPVPSAVSTTPPASESVEPTAEGSATSEPVPSVTPPPSPIVEAVTGTIRGQVVNGTTGEPAPEGLQVTLLGLEGADDVYNATTEVDDAGNFAFDELEIVPGRLFSVSADYQGVTYESELAHLVDESPVLEFPLTVFEATADRSSLSVAQLHLILSSPLEGFVRGVEVWVFSNSGDRAVRPAEGEPLLEVTLPEGAVAVQMTGGVSLGPSSDSPSGMLYSMGVPPGVGSAQLALVFDAPFDGALEIDQPVEVPIESVILLSEAGGLRPRGSAWESLGPADFGGVTVEQFAAEAPPVGEVLEVRLVPAPTGGATGNGLLGVGIGAAVLGASLIVAGLWWYRRRGLVGERPVLVEAPASPSSETMDREALLRAIAALDDEFEARRIGADEYRARRHALKQRALDQARGIRD
jgi:mono/diheme cytochrome c family protein